jgi:hypothetical protein
MPRRRRESERRRRTTQAAAAAVAYTRAPARPLAPRPMEMETAMRSSGLRTATLLSLLPLAIPGGCTTNTHCTDWCGVKDIRGETAEYQRTSVYAMHLLFFIPLLGDASIEHAVKEFTAEASARNAKRLNIEETDTYYYWWVFPPFSFFVQPVVTDVGGQVEGTTAAAVR